jgi:hypothetical protein
LKVLFGAAWPYEQIVQDLLERLLGFGKDALIKAWNEDKALPFLKDLRSHRPHSPQEDLSQRSSLPQQWLDEPQGEDS